MRHQELLTRSGKIDGRSRLARAQRTEAQGELQTRVQSSARVARVSAPAENLAPAPARGKKPAAGKKQDERIFIPPMRIVKTTVWVKGISPYIAHQFSEKAKQQMRDKHQKRAQRERETRTPVAEYEAAKYKDSEGDDAIPSLAFKCAIVDAASFIQGITKVQIRGAVFVEGEFVKIVYGDERMREDVVRVGMGSADLRYRPEYRQWFAALPIEFDQDIISAEQLHHLIQRAGFQVGVGEWRPQKNGQFGRFSLDPEGGRSAGAQRTNGGGRRRRRGLHRVK